MKNACTKALKQTRQGLQSLKGSPRDLYIIYAINACDNFNYFSFSLLFTLYLTEEFGFSDQQVGVLYGLWGCAITAFGFIFGGVVDYLGVKRTLFVAFTLTGCGRLLLTLSKSKALLLFSIFGPVSFGLAFGSPAVLIAVKRYTKQDNRGFAYAVLYAAMNVASLLSGWTLDLFRITFREGFHIQSRSSDSVLNSGYRLYLLLGCVAAVTGFLLNFLIDEHATSATSACDDIPQRLPSANTPLSPDQHRLTEDGDLDSTSVQQEAFGKLKQQSPQNASLPDQKAAQAHQHMQAELQATEQAVPSAGKSAAIPKSLQQIKALTKSTEFLKYMAMCIITVNLKAIFRHLDATLPKYQVRSFGCAAPVGTVYSINPAMIMTLVPLVGAAATHYSHFDMIHYGSYVSALSPVWMALFSTEWATVLFVIQLSLGEAIWSPRWYDYSMSVAPEGREGVFTAMASAPLFLGKFVTGTASGFLLGRFCTNDGVNCEDAHPAPQPSSYRCQGHILWLIITLLTCMSPFGILIFRGWLRPAPKPVHQAIDDTEAGQGVSSGISQDSEGRHAAARMVLPEVLHEAGLGWEETTQLLQGQVTRLVSRDDSDVPDLSSRSPENCELVRTHSDP